MSVESAADVLKRLYPGGNLAKMLPGPEGPPVYFWDDDGLRMCPECGTEPARRDTVHPKTGEHICVYCIDYVLEELEELEASDP